MMIKRIFDTPEGWVKEVNTRNADGGLVDKNQPEGACLNPPPLKGVEVLRCGRKQKFSPELIMGAMNEGWMTMKDDAITITPLEGDPIVYTIVRKPGHYCSHCGESQGSDKAAQLHVTLLHKGKASPDPENPSGYMHTTSFKGVKHHG